MIRSSLLLALSLSASVYALNPIEIKGSKFFDSKTGDQFFMKGVAYQPREGGNSDPLAIPANCKRDIKYLKDLGVNTIRVYESYPWNDHTECMKALEEAGIYLLLDLAIPSKSINRKQPHYDTSVFIHHKQNVDEFSKYSNVIGFFAGNEVSNDAETTPASAHIKALLRDVKSYLKSKDITIPVGYANNDDPDIRVQVQDYFNCGDDEHKADFYGINIYSWCGDSTFQKSGYDERTKELKNYSIPSILSEFGCNTIAPRPFGDIVSLYGSDMGDIFSGGIVYEFSEEDNKYGLVKIDGGKVKQLKDYATVKSQFAKAKPKGVKKNDYKPSGKKSSCPKITKKWEASENLPPTPSEDACECIFKTLKCVVNDKAQKKENGEEVGKIIGNLCGDDLCDSIIADTANGKYGDFSGCSSGVRNSIVLDAAVKKGAKCDFEGFGTSAKPSKDDAKTCAKKPANLKSAPKPVKDSGDQTDAVMKKANSQKDNDSGPDSSSDSSSKDGSSSSSSRTTFSKITSAIILSIAFINA